MNNTSLVDIENEKQIKLQKYKLDEESINEFKSKIKTVDEKTKENLGKELFELISKRGKNKKVDEDFINKVMDLIVNGADIDYVDRATEDSKGNFPLIISAIKGFIDIAYILLRAGANVNQTNKYLTSTLMSSARHGHKELVELLILLGADVNAKCFDGDTALMMAARHNEQECFDLLVSSGAHLNHRNHINETFLDLSNKISFDGKNMQDSLNQEKINTISQKDALALIEEAENKFNTLVKQNI